MGGGRAEGSGDGGDAAGAALGSGGLERLLELPGAGHGVEEAPHWGGGHIVHDSGGVIRNALATPICHHWHDDRHRQLQL